MPVLPPGWSREASWGRMTAERAAGLSIAQLRAELVCGYVYFPCTPENMCLDVTNGTW